MSWLMETNMNPGHGDAASLETLLNSATWEVGALVAPTCEPTDEPSDESEVR